MAERRSTNAALRALQAQEAAWRAEDEERARRYVDLSKIKVRRGETSENLQRLGVNTLGTKPGDKPRNLNVRVKPQAQISAPRISTPDRAIMAVERFSPALGSAVREADDFLGLTDLYRSGIRSAADALGGDVYAGNEDLQYDDRQNLLLNAALTVAGGPLAKGAGAVGRRALNAVPAGVRQGASDLAARGASWLRENAPLLSRGVSAPLRDVDYVEGVFRDLPEEMGAFAVRPQIAPPPQTLAAFRDIRPARENVGDVMRANTTAGRLVGERMRPLSELTGGVSDALDDQRRVAALVDAMSGPEGYIERLIVDDAGNVIEGQHRLDALRRLGVQEVPVIEYRDLERGLPLFRMRDAAAAQGIHPDQAQQIAQQLAEIYADEGGDMAEIAMYEAPRGFENAWQAAMDALKQNGAAPYKHGGLAVKRKAR